MLEHCLVESRCWSKVCVEYRTLWSRCLELGTEPVTHGDELLLVPAQPGDVTHRLLQLGLQGAVAPADPSRPRPQTPRRDDLPRQGQGLLPEAELSPHLTLEEEDPERTDTEAVGNAVVVVVLTLTG